MSPAAAHGSCARAGRPGQPFGQAAKQALSDKVFGRDKYGRTLGTIFVDGRNVNQEMVAESMAWWYERYARHAKELEEAQGRARSAGCGRIAVGLATGAEGRREGEGSEVKTAACLWLRQVNSVEDVT